MELETFAIPTFRRASIEKRIEKLARKATKNGNPDIRVSFGETFIRTVDTEYGETDIEYISVTVTGEAPRIAGWDFLARIELLDEENLVHSVPGSDIQLDQSFRQHNGYCDHCNSARRRNDVFVLSNGSEQIAVGRTCLREFLGIDDPKAIIARAQFFEELRAARDEEDLGGFGSLGYFHLREVLELSAANIRLYGYVSKAKQMETGNSTTGEAVMLSIRGIPGYDIEPNAVDKEWAAKTIKFFRGQEVFGNNYMDNLRIILKQDIIKKEHVNLAASAVITAQRQLAPKSPKEEIKESNFVGEVKTRLKGLELMIDKIIYLGSGSFGPSYLHLMKDTSGNVFSWITGNKIEKAEGETVRLDGTIKEHKLYNGTKQTALTRAKVVI
jgi:hypothetical protein